MNSRLAQGGCAIGTRTPGRAPARSRIGLGTSPFGNLFRESTVTAVIGARDGRQIGEGLDRAAAEVPEELWNELAALGLVRNWA